MKIANIDELKQMADTIRNETGQIEGAPREREGK
jgi:hypothetical protein